MLQYHLLVAELIQKNARSLWGHYQWPICDLSSHLPLWIIGTFILTYVTVAVRFSIPLILLVLMFLNNKHPTITVSRCMSPPLVLTWVFLHSMSICLKEILRYCTWVSVSQMSKLLSFAFPPIEAGCSSFFCLFAAYVARALLILNGLMICMNSLCMTLDLLSP